MKLFISWSKEPAKSIALELRDVIPMVIPGITPWVSEVDIPKGGRWSAEIAKELDETSTGLIIVTPTNGSEPWLYFEAGALSKSVADGRVHPLVFGVEKGALIGPLAQFQATVFERADFLKLLKTLNQDLPKPLSESDIESRFRRLWPALEADVARALGSIPAQQPAAIADSPAASVIGEEHENILRYLLKTSHWRDGPTARAIASDIGLHVERVKHRLSELDNIDFIYVVYSMDGEPEYRLDDKGRRYAVEKNWV